MRLASSFFEWLYERVGKTKCGNRLYRFLLWIYQHLAFVCHNLHNLLRPHKCSQAKVRLFRFSGNPNFGDSLNDDLMRCFNVDYVTTKIGDANCVCIGSILDELLLTEARTLRYGTPINVFGTGFMMWREDEHEAFNRQVNIFALRGKLSQERCRNILGEKLHDVVLGDPGLLVRRMFPDIKRDCKYDVGIICHFKDRTSSLPNWIDLRRYSFVFIDVYLPTREFVSMVAQCGFILSSALHGLICADSFGIPNKWMLVSGKVEGRGYKFMDYYSVFDFKEPVQPVDVRRKAITDDDIDVFKAEYPDVSVKVDSICDELASLFEGLVKNDLQQ